MSLIRPGRIGSPRLTTRNESANQDIPGTKPPLTGGKSRLNIEHRFLNRGRRPNATASGGTAKRQQRPGDAERGNRSAETGARKPERGQLSGGRPLTGAGVRN